MPEAVGVVDVLVAAEPPERGLKEQLSFPSGPWVHQAFPAASVSPRASSSSRKGRGPASDVTLIREIELQPTVEVQPQSPAITFTYQASHPNPSNATATH
jgi:hypothetical protein